uniref:Uncharacterized protein n=1 Tax=Candidatus Kentrum sp. FW TaxID=2126338 RepID=A0A450T9T1_9GAMM|nr:MAG: Uncharacterised protein family (UPF0175) [Candidatus Kentron sp. FW]
MMKSFSTQDLQEHVGELIRCAKASELSIVAEHDQPLFAAVPLDKHLLMDGVGLALACRFYREGAPSLGKAAHFAGISMETLIEHLGAMEIPVVDYPAEELTEELEILSS